MSWQDKALQLEGTPDYIHQKLKAEGYTMTREEVRHHLNSVNINQVQPHRKVIMINQDGSRKSETVIKGNEKQINDETYLLQSHGFNPNEWVLKWAKNSVYNVQRKGGAVDTFYSSKITVQPNTEITEKDTLEHFIEKAEKYSPVHPRVIEQSSKNLLLINICDLHLGQLSWGEESGENYDYKIATARFKKIIHDIISKSPCESYEKICFIIGNDFFNSDNMEGSTTKGTRQTNDVRPQKMFDKGTDLLIWALDALRVAFPTTPIETNLVSGNHDRLTAYYGAKVLYAWFRNDPTVEIDISPKLHKGFAYGDTALLFTHGQHELKNLEWVYTEFRKLIGSTKRTEIHAGHMHRIKVEEKNGVLVRTNPSSAALDNWSYEEGYGATSQAISRVYGREGLDYEIYSRAK